MKQNPQPQRPSRQQPSSEPGHNSGKIHSLPFRDVRHRAVRQELEAARFDRESGVVAAMLHQSADPMTAPLVRVKDPSCVAPEGTAVAKVFETFDVNWGDTDLTRTVPTVFTGQAGTTTSTADILYDESAYIMVLTRQPVVASITRQEASADSTYIVHTLEESSPTIITHSTFLTLTGYSHNDGPQPYGNFQPNAAREGFTAVWLDSSALPLVNQSTLSVTATFSQDLSGGVRSMDITLVRMTAAGMSPVVEVRFPFVPAGVATTVVLPIPSSGYYGLELAFNAANDSAVPNNLMLSHEIVYTNKTRFVMRHNMLLEDAVMKTFVRNSRVNGSSVLVSNRSPDIVQGGTVYATQFPGDVTWYNSFSNLSNITNVNPALRHVGMWKEGLYAFVKPQGSSAGASPFALSKVSSAANPDDPLTGTYNFDPFNLSGFVCVVVSPPTVDPANPDQYATSNATITVCQALEYSTTQQLVNVRTTGITSIEHGEYIDALSQLPQFYDNKFHMSDIWTFVKKTAQKVIEWAPVVKRVVDGVVTVAQMI